MEIKDGLKYTDSHEWLEAGGSVAVGITDYAQGELGDIVFVELPELGRSVLKGEAFAVIESVKAVSSLYAPIDGTVVETNSALEDAPESLNEDAYGAWIAKIEPADASQLDGLMDAGEYKNLIDSL